MNERTLLRAVFDALPSLIFVVDRDVRIHEYNAAAAELIMAGRETVLRRRAGDILHCIHSDEVPEGCGRSSSCQDCIIRGSVNKAFAGQRTVRRRAKIEMLRSGGKREIYGLITVSLFSFEKKDHALLVIEDISEIAALYRMIFVCPVCGKMQNEEKSWMRIESYFKSSWDIDCSHSYCPDCFQKELDEFRAAKNSKAE
jgi:PAS domain-containing protein